jgi:uncharacterized protein (TIRG00374 family)
MSKPVSLKSICVTILSLLTTALIFDYLFTFISLADVVRLIRNVDLRALLVFVMLSLAMSFFRTWRFGMLLKLSGYRPKKTALFLVVLVRNFFSDLLPARMGTLIYIFLAHTRLGIPLAPATSSFAIAFLFDILALLPLLLAAVALTSFRADIPIVALAISTLGLGTICLTLIYLLPAAATRLARQLERWPLFPSSLTQKLVITIHRTGEEVQRARKDGAYAPIMALSLLVRLTKYSSLYVFLLALLLPLGYAWQEMHAPSIFLGLCATEIAASLPISGIAAFGAYEGTWAVVFKLIGFPGHIAKLTAVSHHLFTQVYGYLLGAGALLLLILPFFKVSSRPIPGPRFDFKRRFWSKLILAVILLLILLAGAFRLPLPEDPLPTSKEADLPSSQEQDRRKALASRLAGKIVFDSNRSGSFGLYTVNIDGSHLETLQDDPKWHEMFPDASADGQWIVFSRARATSRNALSEVWIIHRNGDRARMLSPDGVYPTFSSNGRLVYFSRQRRKVIRIRLSDGSQTVIFPRPQPAFNHAVVKPRISRDGRRVAFTSDHPGRWNAWYADVHSGRAHHIAKGCEPVFLPNDRQIAWIAQGRERTGIFAYDLNSKIKSEIEDADGPRGHEYFPSFTADGLFLLFSACRPEEHAHETSNYQIFIKDLDSGERVRITFDAYTNRWPKYLRHPEPES